MSSSFPTIRDFFQASTPPSKRGKSLHLSSPDGSSPKKPSQSLIVGDGFSVELAVPAQHPVSITDKLPRHAYDEVALSGLSPGPRRVKFSARVVNLHDQPVTSKSSKAAKGCLKVLVKDDDANILINLWYADSPYPEIVLGSVLTIWTTHVSSTSSSAPLDALQLQPAPILTSIFPGRDSGCHIQIHLSSFEPKLYRTPLSYRSRRDIDGLISLKNFVEGAGAEIAEAKILVYVKAVGQPTSYQSPNSKSTGPRAVVNVGLADADQLPTEAVLSLFSPHLINSAMKEFVPYRTVLLISYPGWRAGNKISIRARTQIEIDPLIREAVDLRRWAERRNRPFNEHVDERPTYLSLLSPANAPVRHTLASFTHSIEGRPTIPQVAYIPVIMSSVNILDLVRQKRIFGMPCPISQQASIQNESVAPEESIMYDSLNTDASLIKERSTPLRSPNRCTNTTPIYSLHATISTSPSDDPNTYPVCLSPVPLRLNPAIVGDLLDETGSLISPHSHMHRVCGSPHESASNSPLRDPTRTSHPHPPTFLFTDRAYTNLFGRTPEEISRLAVAAYATLNNEISTARNNNRANSGQECRELNLLQYMERRLAWMRVILLVGWTGDTEDEDGFGGHGDGRLIVLDVVG